ncbi:MAG: glycosyltransferase family 39 protein [Ruminococcus sp.]
MNSNKLSAILNRIFHIVFFILFGIVYFGILMTGYENNKLGYSSAERNCAVGFSFVLLLVFAAVYICLQKYNNRSELHSKPKISDKQVVIFIFASVGVLLVLQLLAGYFLQMNPVTDMQYIERYSRDFGATGNFDLIQKDCEKGSVYLIRYPNNLALVFLLSAVYRLCNLVLGYVPSIVPVIINAFAINISVLLTVFTARKIFGNRRAIFVLLLCFLFAPFYTYVPYYYTDSLSMPFCVGAIYLFIIALSSEKKIQKYVLLALSGVLVFLGYKLKGSLIIILAAVLIYVVLKMNIKQMLCIALAVIAGFGSVFAIYTAAFNSLGIVTEEQSDRYEYPYTHWVMMGLKGLGHYNLKDSNYTNSFENKSEKQEANIEEIKNRIKNLGADGLTEHIFNKAVWTWEDGTYYISHHIKDSKRENILHSFVLTEGENHIYFFIYSNGFQLLLILLMLLSILKGCKDPDVNILTLFKGIIFAAFIFFLIWEARSRYLYNFTPLFILVAVDGLDFFTSAIIKKPIKTISAKRRSKQNKLKTGLG